MRRYPDRRMPLRGHLAQAEANTLRYLLDGNRIYTRDDHAKAQQVCGRAGIIEVRASLRVRVSARARLSCGQGQLQVQG